VSKGQIVRRALLFLTIAIPALAAGAAQAPPGSLREGVFTNEQAERGREAYSHACSYCHRDDLSGNEDGAPPLRGSEFLGRWQNRPLSEFHFVLTETMPQDAPSSLTAREYADIISFILKNNGGSVGATELPGDAEALKELRFPTPRKP
jgi:mono/diheme cytochrome c family protein